MTGSKHPVAYYVAYLRRAADLLATVDDAHHPWSHNAYMEQVDQLLLEISPLLNDGYQDGAP